MGNVRKRGKTWNAQVRVSGWRNFTKSFKSKSDAFLKSTDIPTADIKDLRFHGLRHEVISRFFEMGMSFPEAALRSGHKDVKQLLRYTHLDPNNIFRKYKAFLGLI